MTAQAAQRKEIAVRNYHAGARGRIKSVEGEYYGFEMEVDLPGKSMRSQRAVVPNGNIPRSRYQLDAERDGSLNESGVELITKRPLKVTEVRGKWMQSTLARMKDEMGIRPGKQPANYGLHVNVNLQGMTLAETIAFLATLNITMDNGSVQRDIMERSGSYPGLESQMGSVIGYLNMAREQYRVTFMRDKYEALAAYGASIAGQILPNARHNYAGLRYTKAPIAEVRGFHMNTDVEQFKKKADLVQKARRFANQNTKEMLMLFADSIETNVNQVALMTEHQKQELVGRVLNTPLSQQLVTPELELPEHAQKMLSYVETIFVNRQLPTLDENSVLRTRR